MTGPAASSHHRRWRLPSAQNILLVIHGLGWLAATGYVTVASPSHVPPSELWAALPMGISAILVAFRAGDGRERRRDNDRSAPPPQHETG